MTLIILISTVCRPFPLHLPRFQGAKVQRAIAQAQRHRWRRAAARAVSGPWNTLGGKGLGHGRKTLSVYPEILFDAFPLRIMLTWCQPALLISVNQTKGIHREHGGDHLGSMQYLQVIA